MPTATVKATKTTVAPAPEERWRNSSIRPELMVSSKGRVKSREYKLVTPDAKGGFRIYDVPAKVLDTHVSQSGMVMVSFTNAAVNQMDQPHIDMTISFAFCSALPDGGFLARLCNASSS